LTGFIVDQEKRSLTATGIRGEKDRRQGDKKTGQGSKRASERDSEKARERERERQRGGGGDIETDRRAVLDRREYVRILCVNALLGFGVDFVLSVNACGWGFFFVSV